MAVKIWGMQEKGSMTEGKCRSSFALELSIRAGPTHCLALCSLGLEALMFRFKLKCMGESSHCRRCKSIA